MQQLKVCSIEQLSRHQVDGVVRQREAGYEEFVEPSTCKHTITNAHEGGCGSLRFEPSSHKLVSGGQDRLVKIWDTHTGALSCTLQGCFGSVLDLAVTHDNRCVIAASSTNQLFVWESSSGRIRHTLTGHQNKVCAVDSSRASSRNVVSAATDYTIKMWDLHKGFCSTTIVSASNCNALSYSVDGLTVCSGHADGNLRLWDSRSGKLISEVAAHSQPVTSVCISQSGNIMLTSGRDNLHNLFDVRTLEVCGTFRASRNRVASNWSRSCMSPDENSFAAGSADGSVYVWSSLKEDASVLDGGHSSHVLSCAWGGLGKSLASADKNGNICIWA